MPPFAVAVACLVALSAARCGGGEGADLSDVGAGDTTRDVPDRRDAGDRDADGDDVDQDAPDATPTLCEPGSYICVAVADRARCLDDGSAYGAAEPCGGRELCDDGQCVAIERCRIGPIGCVDATTMRVCLEDQYSVEERACGPDSFCVGEQGCVTPACSQDSKSYIGCEFFATNLYNLPDAASNSVYVTVSNPYAHTVEITLTSYKSRISHTEEVGPESVQSFSLSGIRIEGTSRDMLSYHLQASAPVTVHQFNPRNNTREVYSNDASLLLPTGALGTNYRVMAWPGELIETFPLRAFVTVVAAHNDTQVVITPTAPIRSGGGIPALDVGERYEVTLARGEVLTLTTAAVENADLTGTQVAASRPVAVFAGNECANVPSGVPYCDHLEQQLFPVNAWGDAYLATHFAERGEEPSVWRILAVHDGTEVTLDPPVDGRDTLRLDAGEVAELMTRSDFAVVANRPISVGQFMVGAEIGPNEGPCDRLVGDCLIPAELACGEGVTSIGDPAFVLTVPTRQFRRDYRVLVPADYRRDFLTLAFPEGASLTLDGEDVDTSEATSIGATGYRVLRVETAAGTRTVTADVPFGLYAYGYDCNVSYAYPGGLDLDPDD